jgi:pimeloyl-ACP methyl ester carboxylesterase
MSDYGIEHLISGIEGFADALGRRHFHLVGHDWSAFLAWVFAAKHPDRVQSLSALSTPHPDALLNAIETDEDQRQRSRYISFFKMPGGAAESFLQADNYQRLRAVYQGKLSESEINENIRRLAQPGALSAALNWYRALDLDHTWCRLVRSRVIFDAGAPLYEKRPRNILNTFLRLSAVIRSFIRGTNSLWPETVCTSRKRS